MNKILLPGAEHFYEHEARCKCGCGQMIVMPEFVAAMEQYRDALEAPVILTSWNRCPPHNAKEGGAPTSLHLKGMATDSTSEDKTIFDFYLAAIKVDAFRTGGIGLYIQSGRHRVHLDIRGFIGLPPWRGYYLNGVETPWETFLAEC